MSKKFFVTLGIVVLAFSLVCSAHAQETVKIAGMFNLTGGMSSIDTPGLNGAKLKAKLVNEAGGVLGGQMIEVIGYDTKTDQEATAKAAKKALSEGVIGGVGYGDTTFVMAAAPLFQEKGVPFVTSGANASDAASVGGDYMFMAPLAMMINPLRLPIFLSKK